MDVSTLLALLPAKDAAVVLAVIGLFSVVAAALPPPKASTGAYAVIYRLANLVAVNVGHAKNASAPSSSPSVPPAVALFLAIGLGAVLLTACSQTALRKPAGQLFCAIQTDGGGAVVVGLIDATAVAVAGPAAPAVILATGASKNYVDAACAKAKGVPVSPPADPDNAPQVAVVPPTV